MLRLFSKTPRSAEGPHWCVVLLLAFVVFCPSQVKADDSVVKPFVLVVHSYHEGMHWNDAVTRGLKERIGSAAELDIVHLDVKRYPGTDREPFLKALVLRAIHDCKPSVLVAIDDFAFNFLCAHRQEFGEKTPIVFGGVNYWDQKRPPLVTGVCETANVQKTLTHALALHPEAQNIFVINDATETGRANRAAVDRERPKLGKRKILHTGTGTFAETEALLSRLSPTTDIVLLMSWNLDALGQTMSYEDAIVRARSLCKAPMYGVWDFYFGEGIVGGELIESKTHGEEVADLVLQILKGTPPDSIPIVTVCKTRFLLDSRELERFHIPPGRIPAEAEVRFQNPNPLREHALLIGVVTTVLILQGVTITGLLLARARHRRAEEERKKTEEDHRLTLDSINEAILVTDLSGRIIRMNPVAEKLTGWTSGKAKFHPLAQVVEILQKDADTPLQDPAQQVLGTGQGSAYAQARLKHRDGSIRVISFSSAPIIKADTGLAGVVLVFRDITNRAKLEEQLRQSQKMESVGLLAGGVAHDFNNILQVITSNLQLAQDETTPPRDRTEYMAGIEKAARRAAELTSRLLAFGRRQKLKPVHLDLAQHMEETLKMVRRLLPASIEICFSAAKGQFWAKVDPGQIEQIIMNLGINARDAMAERGKLTLELNHKTFTSDDIVNAPWAQPGHFVCIAVSDSGTGMDAETKARIFEPFFSTKPAGQGTGLGLSVVQGIVQQHGGFINVYSEIGLGTTFRIYLPATPPEELKSTPKAAPGSGGNTKGARALTVLVAEDDPGTRYSTLRLLRHHGIEVICVADGEEACTVAASHQGPIHVALLDVVMPRLGGPETARRLARQHPDLKIILCSGHPGAIPRQTEFDPTWHWLTKPYNLQELIKLIESLTHEQNGK